MEMRDINRCGMSCCVVSLLVAVVLMALPLCAMAQAQLRGVDKLSSSLRQLVIGMGADGRTRALDGHGTHVCALVRTHDASEASLADNGCTTLARIGDVFVADIPIDRLRQFAADMRVVRVEAERGNMLQLDSMAIYAHVADMHAGHGLPQAYDGSGVVVGVMDVGFDLTHPTFADGGGTGLRIRRFWDQLSADTVGSRMYVGAEYADGQAMAHYAHSRDGESMYHGTHTLGIAAGNGAGTAYVGMAPGSDICLVSNAVSGDEPFIADGDLYKYTTATDVLGFKYIFDYAESVGKPCVISFSEGSHQDFRGDDQLYYEALSSLVGPGRIIVASAGNECTHKNYVAKPMGRASAGTFVQSSDKRVDVSVKTNGNMGVRTIIYNVPADVTVGAGPANAVYADGRVVISVSSADVCIAADSTLADTVYVDGARYVQRIQAYRSCYNADDMVLDVALVGPAGIGNVSGHALSLELTGTDCDAEAFLVHGSFVASDADERLDDADVTHSILSPGSAPDVICVGATSYRPQFDNWMGERQDVVWGATGMRSSFSSVGPTFDGRTKPDVMAPGANVVSAMSSFYMAKHPEDLDWLYSTFDHDGRTYGWMVNCGTSMSTPVVAGTIAMWLQANPSLSPADVRGILQRTCRPCGDYGAQTANYCGYGAIDGYAGLLDVLGLSGVGGLSADNPRGVSVGACGSEFVVVFDGVPAGAFNVQVYGLDGRKLMSRRLDGGKKEYRMATDLPNGVYAVQINVGKKERSGSVLVRIE